MVSKNATEYIFFDSKKCEACWKCIEVCPKDVFGKVNILGLHKHIKIVNHGHCMGCLKCITVCSHGAFQTALAKK